MKYLILLLALTIAGCSTSADIDCKEMVFIYEFPESSVYDYRFANNDRGYFFKSIEDLSLIKGKKYLVCVNNEYIENVYHTK